MRLSVAMCTYFGKDYIRDQLLSIHRQTVPVDEIVICDDCSEDDTVEIIRKLTKQYDLPVRLFINEWNYGYKKNFEQAICRCTVITQFSVCACHGKHYPGAPALPTARGIFTRISPDFTVCLSSTTT